MDAFGEESERELRGTFRELAWTNQWFGGEGSLKHSLTRIVRRPSATVLDVGSGDGRTLERLHSWAEKKGSSWTTVAVDNTSTFLELRPAQTSFAPCTADGAALPFPNRSFDAVISLQTLHHLEDEQVVTVLREMARVSKGLVIASDLNRSVLSYLGARFLATFVWKNPLTCNDGPLSVRRGFTQQELTNLGAAAGIPNLSVSSYGPFRWVVTGSHDIDGQAS